MPRSTIPDQVISLIIDDPFQWRMHAVSSLVELKPSSGIFLWHLAPSKADDYEIVQVT